MRRVLRIVPESMRFSWLRDPFHVFLAPAAIEINKARIEHLASLCLDLDSKRVLEVGAGIGLLTQFFEERNCEILCTDGNSENLNEMRRRFPNRNIRLLDLDSEGNAIELGRFQIVFCYGVLYHLRRPKRALKILANVCDDLILLETCVALGNSSEIQFVEEPRERNQAVSGIGCRPTRAWVMEHLRAFFGHAYITKTQPRHRDFVLDWNQPPIQPLYRSVFVGSKHALTNPNLTEKIPERQVN
jgi:SAM-dependent methyltransferase